MHPRVICRLIPFPKLILDLGSGLGTYTIFLEQDGCEAHGIDIDIDLIKIARKCADKMRTNPNFVVANAEKLPYQDESFDFCFANSLLEHVKNFETVIEEVARILKANGLFALCTTNRLHPFQREVKLTSSFYFPFYPLLPARLKKRIISYCLEKRPDLVNYTDYPAINWFTHSQLKNLLRKKGFRVFEHLEVLNQSDLKGARKRLLPLFQKKGFLNLIFHVYSSTVILYTIKK